MYFSYTDEEVEYLKKRDKKLAAAIEVIGPIRREVEPEIFPALVHHIVGHSRALRQRAVWARVREGLGEVTPEKILARGAEGIMPFGLSARKADYIFDLARRAASGEFDAEALRGMSDEEAAEYLCRLRGVGLWTAEMLLTFTLQRRDVLSFGDFGIRRGLRMLYRHREIDRERFERYRRRYSPCGTLAAMYLWEIAGGALPGAADPAAAEKSRAPRRARKGVKRALDVIKLSCLTVTTRD